MNRTTRLRPTNKRRRVSIDIEKDEDLINKPLEKKFKDSGKDSIHPQYELNNVSKDNETLSFLDIQVAITNVVGSFTVNTILELKSIAMRARNAEYNPKRFSAVIIRLRDPKTTALIFRTGRIIITGAKTEDHCRTSAKKISKMLQKLGFPASLNGFNIQNVSGTCDVRFPVRLEGIVHDHSKFSTFEPELFPGLIYKMSSPKLCLLIFVSGKIVLTGAKSLDDLQKGMDRFYPVISEYRKQTAGPTAVTTDKNKKAKTILDNAGLASYT